MEYIEELESRTENCLSLIYTARPHNIDDSSQDFFKSLARHTGNPEIFYFNATLRSPRNDQALMKLVQGLLGESAEDAVVYIVQLNIALAIVCKDCRETHYYAITPVTAKIDNEAKAYKLVADLNKVLGG